MSILGWITLLGATVALALVGVYLVKRPALTGAWRWLLFAGLGILPITTSTAGMVDGMQTTQTRKFCNSCHVMEPWVEDASDPKSDSLAAVHTRIAAIGDQSCYVCHADYGMYGTALTKLNGMLHVWHYLTTYRSYELDPFIEEVHLYAPYQNRNCMHCHSTTGPRWREREEHRALQGKRDTVSCASAGCHGSPHPFKPREQERPQ